MNSNEAPYQPNYNARYITIYHTHSYTYLAIQYVSVYNETKEMYYILATKTYYDELELNFYIFYRVCGVRGGIVMSNLMHPT